jgi:hypothetical protein
MNLVFQADGLSTGEGAFLMACCNHTDNRGYVVASMQQLADEAHMKPTAAKANKQRLIKRGLLAAKERYSPKNGARISDLYRVNLKMLAEMKRQRVDYGPSLVEELSFATSQEMPSSDPPSDSDPHPPSDSGPSPSDSGPSPSDSDGDAGADSDPLLLPSSSPSSLSGDDAGQQESQGPVAGEREAAEPKNDNPIPAQVQGEQIDDAGKVVAAYMTAFIGAAGKPPTRQQLSRIRKDAEGLLSAGRTVGRLCELAAQMPPEGWYDLTRHAMANQERQTRPAAVQKDWCGECNDGEEPRSAAQRMVYNAVGRLDKCVCHPGYVPVPVPA